MTSCTQSWWLDWVAQSATAGNPTLPKDSHDGCPGHNATVLGGGDSEKCPLMCSPGESWLPWGWTGHSGADYFKASYPIIRPLPHAPTHHTRTCSCLLSTTWCISSKDSSTTLLRLSSHENYELNKSFVFKSLSLGYFVTARKKKWTKMLKHKSVWLPSFSEGFLCTRHGVLHFISSSPKPTNKTLLSSFGTGVNWAQKDYTDNII